MGTHMSHYLFSDGFDIGLLKLFINRTRVRTLNRFDGLQPGRPFDQCFSFIAPFGFRNPHLHGRQSNIDANHRSVCEILRGGDFNSSILYDRVKARLDTAPVALLEALYRFSIRFDTKNRDHMRLDYTASTTHNFISSLLPAKSGTYLPLKRAFRKSLVSLKLLSEAKHGTENNHFMDKSDVESVAWMHEDQSRLQKLLHVYSSDTVRE